MKHKTTHSFMRAAMLLLVMMLTTVTAWAAERTVTYTFHQESSSGNIMTYAFTRSGNSFGYKTGVKTATVYDYQHTTGFTVELDDDIHLQLKMNESQLTTAVYDNLTGIILKGDYNPSLIVTSGHYYITHIKMANFDSQAIDASAPPFTGGVVPIDLDVDMDLQNAAGNRRAFAASFTGTHYFAQLTITYADAPRPYAISFNEVEGLTNPNPATYSMTTNTFNIVAPTRTGYDIGAVTYTDALHPNPTAAVLPMNIVRGDAATRKAISFNAAWTAHHYSVHYEANGGSGEMADQDFTYDAGQALSANSFTREGYTFVGWNTAADGSGTGYNDGQQTPNVTATDGATVTLYAQWAASREVSYIDANGAEQQVTAILINESQTEYGISGATNWYVVDGEVNLSKLRFNNNNAHLILADGATLSVNCNTDNAVYAENITIYRQSGGTGQLVAFSENNYGIETGDNIYLAGGTVRASSYSGAVSTSYSLYYTDGTKVYQGTLSNDQKSYIAGKTMQPCYSIAHSNIFSVSGAVVEEGDFIYAVPGSGITLSPATGYTLSDVAVNGSPATDNGDGTWSFTMPAENVTVSAVVTIHTYKVHYDKNSEDATGTMDDQDFTYGVSQQLRANSFTAPTGYHFTGWNTAADGSGTGYDDVQSVQNLTSENNATVTLYAQWAAGVEVTYIDADGTEQNVMAIPIDESQTDYGISKATNWYVVSGEVNLDHLHFYNDFTHLILADGARLTANSNTEIAVRAQGFTIYAQSNGTGQIIASSEKLEGIGIGYGNLTINGGNVTATGGENEEGIYADGIITINNGNVTATGGKNGHGINTWSGSITINGGSVTATGGENYHGIHAINFTIKGGNVTATGGENGYGIYTLGGTTTLAGGTVMASSYYGTVKIKAPLYYTDGTKVYQGTLNNYIAGKTMQPALRLRDNDNNNTAIADNNGKAIAVALQGRTLYKDGDWNTLTLPFDLGDEEAPRGHEFDGTPLEGATVKALANSESSGTGYDASTGTLTLYFVDANKIEAGVPYLVKWDKAADYDDNPTDYDIVSPVFLDITVSNEDPAERKVISYDHNVEFRGNYSPVKLDGGDASNLYLGAANQLYWPSADRTINAFRGYFNVNLSGAGQVRSIRLNLGDKVTGVTLIDNGQWTIDNYAGTDSWYDLQGRKLNFKPTQKGIYIHQGRKISIY